MRFCLFDAGGSLTFRARLGLLRGTEVVDVHAACLASLAGHMSARRAGEIASALCPPDLLEFLENGRHGWTALNESLARLGDRLDDPALTTPGGLPVKWQMHDIQVLPLVPWRIRYAHGPVGGWRGVDLPPSAEGVVTATLHTDGRPFIPEFLAVIGELADGVAASEVWEHVALVTEIRPSDPVDAAVLRTVDDLGPDDQLLRNTVAVAVAEASRRSPLLVGDIVRTGQPVLEAPPSPVDPVADESLLQDIVRAIQMTP